MDIEKDSLKKQIREMTQLGYIAPEDLPSIELYMDQRRTVSSANGLTPTNCASANRISPGSAAFLCRPAALSATAK